MSCAAITFWDSRQALACGDRITCGSNQETLAARAVTGPTLDDDRRLQSMRKRKLTAADLRFISENMQPSGFSGRITDETAIHEPDMDAIAESAAQFGAQIPSPQNRAARPRITRFGSHPIDPMPSDRTGSNDRSRD